MMYGNEQMYKEAKSSRKIMNWMNYKNDRFPDPLEGFFTNHKTAFLSFSFLTGFMFFGY